MFDYTFCPSLTLEIALLSVYGVWYYVFLFFRLMDDQMLIILVNSVGLNSNFRHLWVFYILCFFSHHAIAQ